MSQIYRDKEIPIPAGSYLNRSDGRVFIIRDNGQGKQKRQVIGRITSEGLMYPNETFKFLYPGLWEEHFGKEELPRYSLHPCMYAALLGIGYQTGLYPLLVDVYGAESANAIMDYAMYSILERSDQNPLFEDAMSTEVLFSNGTHTQSWYEDFFSKVMTEEENREFRNRWREEHPGEVWLSLDKTAGSRKKSLTLIWFLDAKTGMPVFYQVYRGDLERSDMKTVGVLAGSAFSSHEVISALMDYGYPWLVMLEPDTYGHQCMMKEFARELPMNVQYAVTRDGIFGVSARKKIFKRYPETASISLFYDALNSPSMGLALIDQMEQAVKEARTSISSGEKPVISPEMSPYVTVEEDGDSWKLERNFIRLQEDIDSCGYTSIASSEDLGSVEVNRLYGLREVYENQFACLMNGPAKSLENRFAVCFVSAIIRSELQRASRLLGFVPTGTIRCLDKISLILMPDGTYSSRESLDGPDMDFLEILGIKPRYLSRFAEEYSRRLADPKENQVRTLPDAARKKRGRPQKPPKDPDQPRRKPGRPKGSKNKATLEREATETPKEKRKPGRPKGSKNKRTLQREAAAQREAREKRGPGRPKGSKNKTPEEREAQARLKRRRGRPKGSRNKKTLEREMQEKRKPGRPKGSKNKRKENKQP